MIEPQDIVEGAGLFPDLCGPDTPGYGIEMARLACGFLLGLITDTHYEWHAFIMTWDLTWDITGRNPFA